jgi:hypothetical protein
MIKLDTGLLRYDSGWYWISAPNWVEGRLYVGIQEEFSRRISQSAPSFEMTGSGFICSPSSGHSLHSDRCRGSF